MRELNILHDSLYQFCPELHLKRLNSLMLACRALLDSKTLTLTELGRNLPCQARTKHNIKRMDRLLGNHHLHQERLAVYRWHASFICAGNPMPVVLVDWSDIREHKFLSDLASLLLSSVTPLIISDAGFKVPWYKSVEAHGWYRLSRVKGTVQFAELGAENWQPVSSLHNKASSRAKSLGYQKLTKSNAIHCQIARYRTLPKGRKDQRSTRTHCHHPSPKVYADSAKEPWVLATNLPTAAHTPKQLVRLYAKRMQIEETFRDLKRPAYGLGLRQSRTSCPKRFDVILLIALMLQLMFWLAGIHAQQQGWDRHFQANTVRERNVLSTVRLGMEVLRRPDYEMTTQHLLAAAVVLAEQLLKHGYALADL